MALEDALKERSIRENFLKSSKISMEEMLIEEDSGSTEEKKSEEAEAIGITEGTAWILEIYRSIKLNNLIKTSQQPADPVSL